MVFRFSHTSGVTKFIIIIEFLLVTYLIYALTKNVYNSYLIDKYIDTFKGENTRIEQENLQKTEDYLYFTSEEYIDKIAKQNLGLVNPGEEVIIISDDVSLDEPLTDDETGFDLAKYVGMSNSSQWWSFFFED